MGIIYFIYIIGYLWHKGGKYLVTVTDSDRLMGWHHGT